MSTSIILVLGGVRSGKSAFAEKLVRQMERPTLYLATGQATDAEMAQRILRHREARPDEWHTVEEPLELADGLATDLEACGPNNVVLVDSLDTWVSNLLLAHGGKSAGELESLAKSKVEQLIDVCENSSSALVMVSSEVGHSLVPPNELGRRFQDLLGLVNQQAADLAHQVYLVVAGIPVEIKGATKP